MKKPPDPHPPPSQPPVQSTTQPFYPLFAYQLRFRSSICSSTLIYHQDYASCTSPPPLVMIWSPPMSQLSISVQSGILIDELFGFRRRASRSLHHLDRFFLAVVPAARIHGDSVSDAAEQREIKLSLCSPSLSFSLSIFTGLVDGIFSFICDGERSGYCLTRMTIFDSTHAHDFGWVVNVSYSGFFVTLSLFRILIWTISKHLLCQVCFEQRSFFYPAMVGYTSGSLFRPSVSCYVLMLGLRCFYGFVWILFWVGYCWVSTLNVSMTMVLVTQLQWYLQFICPLCSGWPCYTSMMFVCIDILDSGWILIALEGWLWVLTIYVWLLFMLNCYLDGLMWCFEPCWLLIIYSSELPLVAVNGLWPNHEYVLFTGYDNGGLMLYCNVLVGILFEWLSIWWILCCFHSCCVWQCNVILVYGIGIVMIIPCVWQSECAAYFIVLWFSFWGLSISFGSETKAGCVPGCLSQPSFAPCRGGQPGRRAPRCCLPWSMSSVMIRVVTATLLLSSKGLCQVIVLWVSNFWFSLSVWSTMVCTHLLNKSLWVRLSYAKAELCWCEEHSLQTVSGRRSILQLAFVLMCNCPLFYWIEDLNILLCCKIFCLSGLMNLIWLLLCLASEDRRGCISFRNPKALFQTAVGLRLQLLWLRSICLVFNTEPSPFKIFLR